MNLSVFPDFIPSEQNLKNYLEKNYVEDLEEIKGSIKVNQIGKKVLNKNK